MTDGRATHAVILGDRFMLGSNQFSVRGFVLTAAACAVLAIGVASRPAAAISADAPAARTAEAGSATNAPPKPVEAKRATAVKARRVEFVSAIILWIAIMFVCLGLLVMVMVWGRRLRNSVRRRPAASTVPDPFWYLKKNPKAVAHAKQPDGSPHAESGPDAEGQAAP